MAFKPYDLAQMKVPVSTRHRKVEIISRPTPKETIMVRMVPGEPTTMVEVKLEDLLAHPKKRYLHVALVTCSFVFPEDMLRYDGAALFDHELPEDGDNGRGLHVDEKGLHVYCLSGRKSPPWTENRWRSFSAYIEPVIVRDLRSPTSEIVWRK